MSDRFDRRLRKAFGPNAGSEGPLTVSGAGLRITGVDLSAPLSPEQAAVLLDALAWYRIVTIAGQDLESFSLAHFERFANHWGAPLPHPSNTRQRSGAESWNRRHVEFLPLEERLAGQVNAAFPGQLQCLPHESPAVLVLANVRDVREAGERQAARQLFRGSSWHTDIESDPVPLWVSVFLVHKVPVSRDAPGGTWVSDPELEDPRTFPYFEDSDPELMRLRKRLPLKRRDGLRRHGRGFPRRCRQRSRRVFRPFGCDGARFLEAMGSSPRWFAPIRAPASSRCIVRSGARGPAAEDPSMSKG